MRSPRYSAVLLAFALTTISVTFRALPTVEASTATPLASTPSRYFSLLNEPAWLNAHCRQPQRTINRQAHKRKFNCRMEKGKT